MVRTREISVASLCSYVSLESWWPVLTRCKCTQAIIIAKSVTAESSLKYVCLNHNDETRVAGSIIHRNDWMNDKTMSSLQSHLWESFLQALDGSFNLRLCIHNRLKLRHSQLVELWLQGSILPCQSLNPAVLWLLDSLHSLLHQKCVIPTLLLVVQTELRRHTLFH